MVSIKEKFLYLPDGTIDLTSWLNKIKSTYHLTNIENIEKACHLAQDKSVGLTTFYGQPCIEQGLEMAEIILSLKLDQDAVTAAILMSTLQHTKLSLETVQEKLGENVAKLIRGVQQMETIHNLQKLTEKRDQTQIDRMRKLLLAMVSDIRVVLIKLAERTCIMRGIKNINLVERKNIAQETMDIYAPLANRLGIGQLKWELEDTAFHYVEPESYKNIAKFLAERRADREHRIHSIMSILKNQLAEANIQADISGRAKHIYSIYLKTLRKGVDYAEVYDSSAVRILVPTVQDCYTALSIVHGTWKHIPEEFDDYISKPKPNGYSSIHTAVIGPEGKSLEIQIRTHSMHEEAERGVAAHWMYKENKPTQAGYETKVAVLRQLLDWHRDVTAQDEEQINPDYDQILSDRIYVFTPTGEILDLPFGATPLDCAYYIHSEVGNHCRGAKINGHIVPLTYALKTGDQIEILTNPNGTPSRDWLNPEFGYLTTPRAKSKVSHWFRQQDLNQHIEQGRRTWEREFSKAHTNLQKMANRFNMKDEETFLAALGRGNIRPAQIAHMLEIDHEHSKATILPHLGKRQESKSTGMNIAGINDLMTRIARCCKPIPGDAVIGFITQGRGVSIHKKSCNNVSHLDPKENDRLIEVAWDSKHAGAYYVDILVRAHNRDNLLKEITTLLNSTKTNVINLNSAVNRNNMLVLTLTIQINALAQLKDLLSQIQHLTGVIEAKRLSE